MKKMLSKMMMLLAVIIVFSACGSDDPVEDSKGKAKIENLAISPSTGLTYGDVVKLTGVLSDETGLSSYTIQVSNASGVISEAMQMLTGKSFTLNQDVVIPLAPNAQAGNLTLSLTVKNSGNKLTTENLTINNVGLPNFQKLYIDLNGTIYEMTKNGNIFVLEDFISAGATGKIYANVDKTGIFWGWENNTVKVMGVGDIVFGKDTREYFKISFNAVSFELTLGDVQHWSLMQTDELYILGSISGNWRDNQANGCITVEQDKMKMTGYSLGNRKRWTWEPPAPEGVDDGEDSWKYTMWGKTVAGVFRLKKAGKEEYILYDNGQIVTGPVNEFSNNNFPIPAAGAFNIEVMADETGIISVRAFDNNESKPLSLEYKNGEVLLNGVPALPSITFAGGAMSLVPGNYFLYQGTFDLTTNQSVTGSGINLATLFCDPDIFTGGGNATWTFTGPSSTYYFRVDAFSGHVFARNTKGYPDAIYMDGWCWKKYPGDPRTNWNTGTELTLHRVGTSSVYEATCYIQQWGGDIKFFSQPATESNPDPAGVISVQQFALTSGQKAMSDRVGIKLPIPASEAPYKVSVDLKDGMNSVTEANGSITNTPKGAKFTFEFTPL